MGEINEVWQESRGPLFPCLFRDFFWITTQAFPISISGRFPPALMKLIIIGSSSSSLLCLNFDECYDRTRERKKNMFSSIRNSTNELLLWAHHERLNSRKFVWFMSNIAHLSIKHLIKWYFVPLGLPFLAHDSLTTLASKIKNIKI